MIFVFCTKQPHLSMIYTITILISTLVIINFLLLKLSCNKTTKKISKKPIILSERTTNLSGSQELAPTGS